MAREREAFEAHWQRVLADDAVTKQTIVFEGSVAGNIVCFEQGDRRLVGYWVGRGVLGGRVVATGALAELLAQVTERPLHAFVARANVASIRVVEKCVAAIPTRRLSRYDACEPTPAKPASAADAVREILGSEARLRGSLSFPLGGAPEFALDVVDPVAVRL